MVLCCTSIPSEQRVSYFVLRCQGHPILAFFVLLMCVQTVLAKQAEDMGALHRLDLTAEVTHLIVGEYDTPKYRFVAKQRPDVRVMRADWVEAMRLLWTQDEEIDVAALEQEYTLQTFAGLRICLTGFEDRE